jgi:glycosyltransferase 2 family protein
VGGHLGSRTEQRRRGLIPVSGDPSHVSRPAPVGPAGKRHPSDLLRSVLGASVLVVTSLYASVHKTPGRAEEGFFRLVNRLPSSLELWFSAVMQAGSLAAVPICAALALVFRRPRLARDIAVAGSGSYVLARVIKEVVDRNRPGTLLDLVSLRGVAASGEGFPSGHVAVAAAIATAAAPYLPRRARRILWAIVAVVAVARMYVGAHLPIDVIGGAALGWTVGAAVHLMFGAPEQHPSIEGVTKALRAAGFDPSSVVRASVDARGSVPYFILGKTGREFFVKAIGREQRDADLLFKVWRFLVMRQVEDEAPFTTPKQQAEHEAYMSLLAERAGASTPSIAAVAPVGGGAVLIVERWIHGHTLEELPSGDITHATVSRLWENVARLRSARIAHRDLRAANILIAADGRPWLLDFGFAESAATRHRLAQDLAELLTSIAVLIGPQRAVKGALKDLGPEALAASLPLLQPHALSAATRRALKSSGVSLGELRSRAAAAAGVPVPELEVLPRIRLRALIVLLLGGFAVHLLLPQIGELPRTLEAVRSANVGWLLLALAASAGSYAFAAVSQIGATASPLAFGPTLAVQVAGSFANRLTPGSWGGLGLNVRYLEGTGLDASTSVAAVALNAVTGVILHTMALLVSLILLGRTRIVEERLPHGWALLVAVVAVLAVIGVLLWSPLGRKRWVDPARKAVRNLGLVLWEPVKTLELLGGSAGVSLSYILALAASLHAFNAHSELIEVAAVYLGAAAIASISPTPGGLGAMEAALVAGLTSTGTSAGAAVAGVLAFRLATFWLPIPVGALALRALKRRHVV